MRTVDNGKLELACCFLPFLWMDSWNAVVHMASRKLVPRYESTNSAWYQAFDQSEVLCWFISWDQDRGKTTIDWGKISKLSTASLWVSREMERITISLILCKRLEKIVTICMLRLFEFGAFVLAEATPSEPFIVSLIRLNLAELQEETESKMGIHTILQKHK